MIFTRLLPLAIAVTTATAQYTNSTSGSDDDLPSSTSGSDDDQPSSTSVPLPEVPTPAAAGWFDGEYLNFELWISNNIAPAGYQGSLLTGSSEGFSFSEGNATLDDEPLADDAVQITETDITLSFPPLTGNQSVDFRARAPLPAGEFGVGNYYTASFIAVFQNDTTSEEGDDDSAGLQKRADLTQITVDGIYADGVFYRTFDIVIIIDWSQWTNSSEPITPGPTPTPPAPGNGTTTEYGWSTVTETVSNVVTVYTTWCPISTYTKTKPVHTYTKTKKVHTVTTDEAGRETTVYHTETEVVTFTKEHPKGTTIIVTQPTKGPEDDTTKTTVVQHTSVVSTVPQVSTFDNLGNSVVAGAVGIFVPLFFLLV